MRRMEPPYGNSFPILLAVALLAPLEAESGDNPAGMRGGAFALTLENDIVARTDYEYTHGIKVTWVIPDLHRPGVPDAKSSALPILPLVRDPGRGNVSLSIGQTIFTPRNIEYRDLIENDRPYAGIAYASLGIHRKNERILDTIEFTTGIIGPHSCSEYLQDRIHYAFKADHPHGWNNQIDDEFLLNVFLGRRWRAVWHRPGAGQEIDALPHVGLSLGNALTAFSIGVQVRAGTALPRDYGTLLIGPGSGGNAISSAGDAGLSRALSDLSLHIFTGIDGYAVTRNITLDGNSFRESHHIKKEPLVAELLMGAGVLFSRWKITYAHVYRTRSFEGQQDGQLYGSATVSYLF